MIRIIAIAGLVAALASAPAWAGTDARYCRELEQRREQAEPDVMERQLISPDEAFCKADLIGLTDHQRRDIELLARESRSQRHVRSAELGHARRDLAQVLRQRPVSEPQARAALNRVLDAERAVKQANLTLMVRTTNVLTREQRATIMQHR
jgi:Spy/CpxP family protein refolding chaperone